MTERTWRDAVAALEAIAARVERKTHTAGAPRRDVNRWRIEHAALTAAVDELREGRQDEVDADAVDVPPPVAAPAGDLAAGPQPPHPHAGAPAGDAAGHCWACVIVGHLFAHPELRCADVGCAAASGEQAGATGSDRDLTDTLTLTAAEQAELAGGVDLTETVDLTGLIGGASPLSVPATEAPPAD